MNLTPRERTTLAKAWAKGIPTKTIAAQMGFRSANTVTVQAIELGLPSRRPNRQKFKLTPEIRAEIKARYGLERTPVIAARLGISKTLVAVVAKDEGCDMAAGRRIAARGRARVGLPKMAPPSRPQPASRRCGCGVTVSGNADCPRCGASPTWVIE